MLKLAKKAANRECECGNCEEDRQSSREDCFDGEEGVVTVSDEKVGLCTIQMLAPAPVL